MSVVTSAMDCDLGRAASSYEETKLYECDVLYGTNAKSKGRSRRLVLGSLWLFLYKPRHPRKPEIALHHFDLESIEGDSDVVVLRYSRKKSPLYLRGGGSPVVQLNAKIRAALRDLHCGAPEHSYLNLTRGPALTTFDAPEYSATPGESVAAAFRGWCAHDGVGWRREFGHFVSARAGGSEESVTLDFGECPGIDGQSQIAVELIPALKALAHDRRFRGVVVRDCDQKTAGEICLTLGAVVRTNSAVTMMAVERCWGEQDLTTMAANLAGSMLSVISFSGTRIAGSSFLKFCESIASLRRHVVSLDFSECRLGPKCMAALFTSLLQGDYVTSSLEHLSISGNKLETLGTASLVAWLDNYKNRLPLLTLSVARTSPEISLLLPLLRNSTGLQRIDLSGNSLGKVELIEMVRSLVASSERPLEFLGLNDTSMPLESVEGFVSAFGKNSRIREAALCLADNALGSPAGGAIARAALSVNNLVHLDASHNKLGSRGLCELLSGLSQCRSLVSLNLSNNLSGDKDTREVFSKLVDYLSASPSVIALAFSTTKQPPKHAAEGLPLLRYLAESKLRYLDVSGQHFGDIGASEIARSLRTNATLTDLSMDHNHVGLAGFQYLAQALQENSSLQHIRWPHADLETFEASHSSSDTVRRDLMRTATDEIHDRLRQNFRELGVPEFAFPTAWRRPEALPPDSSVPTVVQKTSSNHLPPVSRISDLNNLSPRTETPRQLPPSRNAVTPPPPPPPLSLKPTSSRPPPLPPRNAGAEDVFGGRKSVPLFRSKTTMALPTELLGPAQEEEDDEEPPPLRKSVGFAMIDQMLDGHRSEGDEPTQDDEEESQDKDEEAELAEEQVSTSAPPVSKGLLIPPPPPLPGW